MNQKILDMKQKTSNLMSQNRDSQDQIQALNEHIRDQLERAKEKRIK